MRRAVRPGKQGDKGICAGASQILMMAAGNLKFASPRRPERSGMGMNMEINVGDTLKLKKQHPCGGREWEVLRTGADFRLRCKSCGRQIMIARKLLEKNVKEILPGE